MLPLFSAGPLTVADLWSRRDFQGKRDALLPIILKTKQARRCAIGPHATLLFESKLLIWWQIQEMLRTELTADPEEELSAYAPLLPEHGLSATLFLEYPQEQERKEKLFLLKGIESCLFLSFKGVSLKGIPSRTSLEKACAVSFFHFPFTPQETDTFLKKEEGIFLSIIHPYYTYQTEISLETWNQLCADLSN